MDLILHSKWIGKTMSKEESAKCCPHKIYFSFQDTDELKVKRWQKIFDASGTKREQR